MCKIFHISFGEMACTFLLNTLYLHRATMCNSIRATFGKADHPFAFGCTFELSPISIRKLVSFFSFIQRDENNNQRHLLGTKSWWFLFLNSQSFDSQAVNETGAPREGRNDYQRLPGEMADKDKHFGNAVANSVCRRSSCAANAGATSHRNGVVSSFGTVGLGIVKKFWGGFKNVQHGGTHPLPSINRVNRLKEIDRQSQ